MFRKKKKKKLPALGRIARTPLRLHGQLHRLQRLAQRVGVDEVHCARCRWLLPCEGPRGMCWQSSRPYFSFWLSADPAAVFDVLLVRPSRSVLDAALAALGLVSLLISANPLERCRCNV